jgi:NitT/TauT family transport system permease protein
MSAPVENIFPRVQSPGVESEIDSRPGVRPPTKMLRARTWLAIPVAAVVALAVHFWASKRQTLPEPQYFLLLEFIFGAGALLAILQLFSTAIRNWVGEKAPIIAAFIALMAIWEVVTSGFKWLPMPYFPGPGIIWKSMLDDRKLLLESAGSSFVRLLGGYAIGVTVALVTGVCIGWFNKARYWGMPLLKIIGPIPATAWIPLAMVLSPNPNMTPFGLVAIAVWFPVTMLTISGIANTRASYLDVARTLGADEKYLVFGVAIPAAMPNIFVGLFMGLGASFLTLIAAETVGVKSGLGWYIEWARNYAEYGKVFGALIIMAAFFSTIMTGLFKVRDRVLAWQKGMIKW